MNKVFYPVVHVSVDMQGGYLRYLDDDCGLRLTRNANHFIAKARAFGVPTIAVGFGLKHSPVHCVTAETPLVQPADRFVLGIGKGDRYCFKKTMSFMKNRALRTAFRQWRTEHVIVSGNFSDACAGRSAFDVIAEGMRCTLLTDLTPYIMLKNPRTCEPQPYWTEYNTPGFFEVNERRVTGYAAELKMTPPEFSTGDALLAMLGALRPAPKEKAAPTERPSLGVPVPA